MEMINVRTRFAPSPTGMLHFGNANTALFNWLIARRYGGKVVLRVEDTDTERSTDNFERKITDDLKWLGIDWDEGPDVGGDFGPYRQMERTQIYLDCLAKLVETGHAYRCYCTKERLEQERQEQQKNKAPLRYGKHCRNLTPDDWKKNDAEGLSYTVRFKTPASEKLVVEDLIRGDIVFDTAELDDFIFVRSSGVPVFLLTNAVDDALMKISHVVRGEDHISNTPKQILINRALGLHVPKYLHTAIILGRDRTKLSKRHGAVSVFQFREQGYLSEAMVNYLAFLGWNPKDEREIFSMPELVKEFSIEAMSKAPSVFDYDRLHYLNAQWMLRADRGRLVSLCTARLVESGLLAAGEADAKKQLVEAAVAAAGERLKTVNDIDANADFFFREPSEYQEAGVKKHFKHPETAATLLELAKLVRGIAAFTAAGIEEAFRKFMEERQLGAGRVIHPTRLSITGKTVGPGLYELMEILGADACAARLEKAAAWLAARPPQDTAAV